MATKKKKTRRGMSAALDAERAFVKGAATKKKAPAKAKPRKKGESADWTTLSVRRATAGLAHTAAWSMGEGRAVSMDEACEAAMRLLLADLKRRGYPMPRGVPTPTTGPKRRS